MKSFFASIGNFFKKLFTKHNAVAVVTTAERAVQTAGDIASGNVAAAAAEIPQVVDAAKSITTK